jgi:hypothetical protein
LASQWSNKLCFPFFEHRIEENRSTIWDVDNNKIPIIFSSTSKCTAEVIEKLITNIKVEVSKNSRKQYGKTSMLEPSVVGFSPLTVLLSV